MRHRVARRYHGLHPASIAQFLVANRNKFHNQHGDVVDVTIVPGLFCDELTEWLDGRSYRALWYDGSTKTQLDVEFTDAQDSLLFKLTWGGK